MPAPSALCFGEILWDFLPDGLFPGGAPFNVGYHLHRLGIPTHIVSAVGRDVLGEELCRRVARWGMPVEGIARVDGRVTGYVRATISPGGDARYEIVPDVAWDEISVPSIVLASAAKASALIFGSLAQRSLSNRAALGRLLAALPSDALRVFDVNLRAPHDDPVLVRTLARGATLLKLNHEEAGRLVGLPAAPANQESMARTLAAETGCPRVVITAGARGAGLLSDGRWHWEEGRQVVVADTIGSGDAFLAALVCHLLAGRPERECLARACRFGEWVATQRGATPNHPGATPGATS